MPLDNKDELFVVVDQNDNVIGHRTRYDCHHDKSLIHRSVYVLIYNAQRQLLLQKRSMNKDTAPGKWALSASGHVAQGESYEEAAKRELSEEIGISCELEYLDKTLVISDIESEYSSVFKGHHEGPFEVDSAESDFVNFVELSDLQKMTDEIAPGSRAIMKYLHLI